MALVKITLEKPALIEEWAVDETEGERERTSEEYAAPTPDESNGGSRAVPGVALLVLAVAVALAGRKLRAHRRANMGGPDAESHAAAETESADENGGGRGKTVGLAGGLVALVLVARKLRARTTA